MDASIQEVPRPTPPPGGVLIRTTHSVISVGTEKMKCGAGQDESASRAPRARPDQPAKLWKRRAISLEKRAGKSAESAGVPHRWLLRRRAWWWKLSLANTRFRIRNRGGLWWSGVRIPRGIHSRFPTVGGAGA